MDRRTALVALALVGLWSCGDDERDGAARNSFAGRSMPGDGPESEALEPAPAAPEIPSDAPTVAFLGDSICAGLHLAEHQAFPALLARRMADEGLPFRLVNSCESGRTSAGARSALPWVLRSVPDLVVLEIGGNDGLRGIPLAEIETNLRALIEAVRDSGADVLLLGVRIPPNYGEYAASFDALYPRLAAEYELAFVPYFMEGVGGVAEQNVSDGLHPTPEGQALIADNVAGELRKLLQGLSRE